MACIFPTPINIRTPFCDRGIKNFALMARGMFTQMRFGSSVSCLKVQSSCCAKESVENCNSVHKLFNEAVLV